MAGAGAVAGGRAEGGAERRIVTWMSLDMAAYARPRIDFTTARMDEKVRKYPDDEQ